MYTYVAAKMKKLTGFMADRILVFNSCNSVNICPIFKHGMSKSKFMSHLSETKKLNRTKGFCSIVDQTQDLLLDTRYMHLIEKNS